MRIHKILATTGLLTTLTVAAAAQPDCSTLRLSPNGGVNYRDIEVFPNPAQAHRLDLEQQTKPFKRTLCGVILTADAKSYSFQAKDVVTLSRAMGGYGQGWSYEIYGKSVSNGKTGYIKAANLDVALPDGLINGTVKVRGYFIGAFLPNDALMAVKINGGPLKPLLYNGSFRAVTADPKTTKLLELFIKSSKPVIWEKMTLDVRNAKMTFVKKAVSPAK